MAPEKELASSSGAIRPLFQIPSTRVSIFFTASIRNSFYHSFWKMKSLSFIYAQEWACITS